MIVSGLNFSMFFGTYLFIDKAITAAIKYRNLYREPLSDLFPFFFQYWFLGILWLTTLDVIFLHIKRTILSIKHRRKAHAKPLSPTQLYPTPKHYTTAYAVHIHEIIRLPDFISVRLITTFIIGFFAPIGSVETFFLGLMILAIMPHIKIFENIPLPMKFSTESVNIDQYRSSLQILSVKVIR